LPSEPIFRRNLPTHEQLTDNPNEPTGFCVFTWDGAPGN
jgi:hypothetical protein